MFLWMVMGIIKLQIITLHQNAEVIMIFKFAGWGILGQRPTGNLFSSPIISYGHIGLNNRRNEVAFFESGRESSMYGGNRVRLYYWSFTADDDDITNLLVSLGGYLDGDNPTRENTYYGKLARYEVIKAPYNTYSANKTNCFRAVAQWTKALGKSQLQNIYDDADSSSDYYAYKLANQLAASYWTDMGIKNY